MTYTCPKCKRNDLYCDEVVFRYGINVRYCKECRNKIQAEYRLLRGRKQERYYQIKSKYGITKEQYESLLKLQDNKCAICNQECKTGRELSVDHDHNSNKIRGLLCNNCNRVLGLVEENIEVLHTMIRYIISHGL